MPAIYPASIIQSLPEVSWRGLDPVPCSAAPYKWAHNQAERQYPYLDGAGHDWTGRGPLNGTLTLYFINTINEGRVAENYPGLWNDYRPALLDGTSGDLVHPDFGTLRARILTGSVELVATNTAGVVVQVEWTETIDDLDTPVEINGATVSATAAASSCTTAMNDLGIDYPTGEPDNSLLDAIKSIEGQILSLGMSLAGKINQVMGAINSILDGIDRITSFGAGAADPTKYFALTESLIALHAALFQKLTATTAAQRATGKRLVTADTTLDAFADQVGNSLEDVMALNLSALRSPVVAKGSTLNYYLGR